MLWEHVVDVISPADEAGGNSTRNHPQFEQLQLVDRVPPNINISISRVRLFVFEGNEAVIEMITTGRRPTMPHASTTHRVELDQFFGKVNFGSSISMR